MIPLKNQLTYFCDVNSRVETNTKKAMDGASRFGGAEFFSTPDVRAYL